MANPVRQSLLAAFRRELVRVAVKSHRNGAVCWCLEKATQRYEFSPDGRRAAGLPACVKQSGAAEKMRHWTKQRHDAVYL